MNSAAIQANCQEVASLLKTIAHPQRLMILCHLSQAEMSVSELQLKCALSQSQLSQFLKRMTEEGLLTSRRAGNFMYYRLSDPRTIKLIKSLNKIFCPPTN